jgi:hypothetical protein
VQRHARLSRVLPVARLPDAEAAKRAFQALADGGQITLPIGPTFWSPCFGMPTDRFGVGWMVTVAASTSAASRPVPSPWTAAPRRIVAVSVTAAASTETSRVRSPRRKASAPSE